MKLKQSGFTLIILLAVAVAMIFPQWFTRWGGFETKNLIIPLLQLITFGVGCTMSIDDFMNLRKMPWTIGFGLGYAVSRLLRLSEADSRTIALEVGMQNGGLASGIAASMGKIATLGLAAAVNGPLMNTVFSVIASWWSKKV